MICTGILLINLTSFAWNQHDMKIVLQLTTRCAEKYEDAPCLSKLIKFGERDYIVRCKAKEVKQESNNGIFPAEIKSP